MLDAACAWKLGSLAFKLLAGASKALDHEAVATFLEIGATSVEAGEAVHDRQRDIVRTAAGRLQAHIERHSDEWLRAEFGSDPSGRADAAAAIAALGDILPKCLPDGLKVAQANLDTERIAGLVVAKAGAGDEMFRKDTFGERLLRCLVQRAYEEAKRDRDFAAVIGIPVQQVLLERTDALLAGQAELPDAIVSRLVAALDMRRAESGGLERETITKIARRLRPDEMLDFDQAVVELERAVDVALDVIARGERGTNYDAFVDLVLAKVAEKTRLGDFDGGAQAVDEALIDLDRREAEQRDIFRRSRVALLEAGVDQDILRRDASAVAQRIEAIVAVEHPNDRPTWSPAFRERYDRFYEEGETKGVNFSLSMAIELAERMAVSAQDSRERGAAGNLLGLALWRLGERESGTARLEEAVAAYHAVLAERTRDRAPLDWAMTQNNLGTALQTLGERESGTARLEEAVAAYRAVLEEWTRDRVPLDWAMTQNNLGTALQTLGERESGTARLEEAVAAYRAVLEEWTRDRVPLDWAMTQNNLGAALRTLGARESGTARLEEAVAAYRAALAERTRERAPLDWAMTQNNLGAALQTLGERESGTARLEEAVAAYRAALAERTRDRVPLQWATTQNNLGTALARLGERESGTARLEEAVAAYRAALAERTRDRAPLDWAMTQNNLGNALGTLGARESGTVRLEEAVAAYRAVLEEWTQDRVPLQWAMTQNNLGGALRMLGERESGTVRLEEAVAAYRAALAEGTRDRVPLQWATAQNNLGAALGTLGERENGTARLEEAVAAFRAVLKEWTRDRVPLQWAGTQDNLGVALRTLGARESGTARLEEAMSAFRAALAERTRERVPLQWAMSTGNQGVALMMIAERLGDSSKARAAVEQIEIALATMREGGHAPYAAYYEAQLPRARALLDRLAGS